MARSKRPFPAKGCGPPRRHRSSAANCCWTPTRSKATLHPTDEAQLVEQFGHPVTLVEGSPLNFKITTHDDFRLAEAALDALPKPKTLRALHPFADEEPRMI